MIELRSYEESKNPDISQSPTAPSVEMTQTEFIDPKLEKRTMLKVDTVVLGCFGIMYLLANLDRNNLVGSSLC